MPLLFFTLFNSILGLSVLFPILGPLGRELHLGETQVGAISTAYALMQMLLSPWWGRKSEALGRKKILLVGIFGFGLGFALLGTAAEIGRRGLVSNGVLFAMMLTARLLGGAFSSAMLPTAQAFAADLSGRERRTQAMAMIGAAFGLAIIFGPAIGAGLSYFGLLAPIWFSAGFAVVNGVLAARLLREPVRSAASLIPPPRLRETANRVWPLLLVAAVSTAASVLMEQTVAFLVEDRLHLQHEQTARHVGMALVAYGVVAVAVQGGLARRVRWAPTTLVRTGLPITLLGLLVLMGAFSMPSIVASMALLGFGQGLVLPGVTSAISLAAEDHEQGAVAGLSNSAQGLGRLIGPLLGTSLYELRQELPYATAAGLVALSLLFVVGSPQMRALARRHREAALG